MPTCEDCGGSDFYLSDGLYFCVSCNLQSQDIVETEMEAFFEASQTTSLAQRKDVHGMLEEGRMGTHSRMESMKSIEPMGTFQILQQVLEKQLDFYCGKLQDNNVENFKNWSQKIWNAYEMQCKDFADDGKFVTLREFMYNTHPNHFYLLYELEHYLIRYKRLKQRVKRKKSRKRKKAGAELKKATNEATLDEAVGSVDIEGFLSPQNEEADDGGSVKSAAQGEDQMDLAEFLNDEVCVDSGIEDNSFSAPENNTDPNWEKNGKHDEEKWDEQFQLFYSAEEIKIFQEMVSWLSTNFPVRLRTATEKQRILLRPNPTVCLSTIYVAAALAQIPLSDVIFISNIVKHISQNKLVLLDLTHSLPSVVLTKHELAHWIPLDFWYLSKRIRKSSFLLYKFLNQPLAILSASLDVSMRNCMIEHCCSKALELLNLPASLTSICFSLMDAFYMKYLKYRDYRRDRSSMSANLFRLDAFIFASVYFIKKITIDCCVHSRVKQLSRKWTQWAHHTLFNSSKVPPHFYLLGNNSKLHHHSNHPQVLKHIYFTNLLKNRNYTLRYTKLGGLPRNTKKKEKMKDLISNAKIGGANTKDNGAVMECEAIDPEQINDLEKLAADLEYKPDLRQVNLKLDEIYVLKKFFNLCKTFKIAKDIKRVQWEYSSLESALFSWQLNKWKNRMVPNLEKKSALENSSDAENIESDVPEDTSKTSEKKDPQVSQPSSTIVQTFAFKKRSTGREKHLAKICQHFSTHLEGGIDSKEDQLECPSAAKNGFSLYDELFCIFSSCGGEDFRSYLSIFIGAFRETYGSADQNEMLQ